MSITDEQRWAIGEEVLTSINLVRSGLGHLQAINGANDFYHLPMLLLASGFERLMKTIICLHSLRETGDFPTRDVFPRGRRGHDLVQLVDTITNQIFDESYLRQIPAARQDVMYLRTDARLRELIGILSEFGQSTRYYYLDTVLGNARATSSPEQQWQSVEIAVLKEDSDWANQLRASGSSDKLYKRITGELVVQFERYTRALVRLFTIGGLGDEAKRLTATIAPFLFLSDDERGRRDYRS